MLHSVALLSLNAAAWQFAASGHGIVQMPPTAAASSVAMPSLRISMMAAADEPATSFSKEILDDAKDEEEQDFLAEAAKAAAFARSDEGLAELRTQADAAIAALKGRDDVAAVLEAKGKDKVTGKLAKALKKPSGSMALIGEGVMMESISLGGFDLNDPNYVSSEFRVGGCTAVSVRVGQPRCLSDDALQATRAEQDTAKGNFPGPLPIISRTPCLDELQIAQAKLDGAVGVLLPLNLAGVERTGELMAAAAELGMESMVRVCDGEELSAALGLGAKILVFGDCTLDEAAALLPELPAGKKDGAVSVADFPTLEVRGAWKVRDAGFNALLAGESLFDMCVRDRVPPSAICKSILSKGSVKYGLGMQKGRLEGSKEFLGTISA